jgi:hypothetical protein
LYSNINQGVKVGSSTKVKPFFHNAPVWIVTYQNVSWIPISGGSQGKSSASKTVRADVYVIFSPTGHPLETEVMSSGLGKSGLPGTDSPS